MSRVHDIDEERAQRTRPFKVHNVGDFEGKPIPEPEWLIPSVLIRRSITLMAGDGGVGKSLLCVQLQVAAALGKDWLGLPIPKPVTSFGFYCEDDEQELHRRFARACKHYGATMAEVGDTAQFACRVGEPDNEVVTFRGRSEFSKAERTATYSQLEEHLKGYGVQMAIFDTVSDIFAGNENVRYQVKSFVTQLRRLALLNNGGVILTAHPSKSAMIDGSGFSGSTAWNGAVRNRLYFSTPKKRPDEEDDGPTDERVLRVMKSNYGPFGQKVRCKWENGIFVEVTTSPGTLTSILADNDRFLKAVKWLIETEGAMLASDTQAKNSCVSRVRRVPSCKDMSHGLAEQIQKRLLADNKLAITVLGPPSRPRSYIRPADMFYPGERKAPPPTLL